MKIGFCFLTYESISFENEIWKPFFRSVPHEGYGIYIHHKFLEDRDEFKTILENSEAIPDLIETARGYPNLVRATENLFSRAFEDGCDYVFLISGDMIPLCSFHQLCGISDFTVFKSLRFEDCNRTCPNCLQDNPHYAMKEALEERYKEYFIRNPKSEIKKHIPTLKDYMKQFMFFGMTKKDFLLIQDNLKYDEYEKLFGWHWGMDEHYWISACSILNINYVNLEQLMVCNTLPHQTQAQEFDLTENLRLEWDKYFFIRKIKSISKGVLDRLYSFYKKDNKNLFVLRKKPKQTKFFNISLHRSATNSFHDLCINHGLRSLHWYGINEEARLEGLSREEVAEKIIKTNSNFDAYSDLPIPSIYDILDQEHPESKFLLVLRDVGDWIVSTRKHTVNRCLGNLERLQYEALFDKKISHISELSDEEMTNIYNLHTKKAKKYFSKAPWKLEIVNLESESFSEDIKSFLEIESNDEIPHKRDRADMSEMRPLIVVTSCQKNSHLWGSICSKKYAKDLIIICGKEMKEDYKLGSNVLYLNCDDSYEGLPEKMLCAYKAISRHDRFEKYTHILKVDDNKINGPFGIKDNTLDNIKNIDVKMDYIGKKVWPTYDSESPKWHFGKCTPGSFWEKREYNGPYCPYSCGAQSYILSKHALVKLTEYLDTEGKENIAKKHIFEDLMIGLTLKDFLIHPEEVDY